MPVIITMWINKKMLLLNNAASNNRIDPNEQEFLNFCKNRSFHHSVLGFEKIFTFELKKFLYSLSVIIELS